MQPSNGGWVYCLRACFGVGADAQALCAANLATKSCAFAVVRDHAAAAALTPQPGDYAPSVFQYESGAAQTPYASGATASSACARF